MEIKTAMTIAAATAAIMSGATGPDATRCYVAEIQPAIGSTADPGPGSGRLSVTYLDGLGRRVSTVMAGESGDGNDLATVAELDGAGRVVRSWLPFSTGVSGGAFPDSPAAMAVAAYGDTSPYSATTYDPYHLNLASEVTTPGEAWVAHPRVASCRTTDPADPRLRCRRFNVSESGTLTTDGYWPSRSLRVATVSDEDGLETLTFTDRAGRNVLTRRAAPGGAWADTYYVYDIYGDLRYMISPSLSAKITRVGAVKASLLRSLAYYYEYDTSHRMTLSRCPGCEPVYMVYDRLGDMIMSQDGSQRTTGEWTLIKYDSRRRPAVRGTFTLSSAATASAVSGSASGGMTQAEESERARLQRIWGDSLIIEEPVTIQSEHTLQYTCDSGPDGFTPLEAWHYDGYGLWTDTWPGDAAEFNPVGEFPSTGMLTVSLLSREGMMPVMRAYRYDSAGRLTAVAERDVASDSYSTHLSKTLDFQGSVTATEERARLMAERETEECHTARWEYEYDRSGRIATARLSVDGGEWVTAAGCSYDLGGRLSRRWSGQSQSSPAISVDYGYNARGDVTDVSSARFTAAMTFGPSAGSGQPRYGGSPCAVTYVTEGVDGRRDSLSVALTYDELDRLTSMTPAEPTGMAETRAFDLNGNITSLRREVGGVTVRALTANYDGNKLSGFTDTADAVSTGALHGITPGDYGDVMEYDGNGRLTADGARGVTLTYGRHIGVPTSAAWDNGMSVSSEYLPDGTLLTRRLATPRVTVTTSVTAAGDTVVKTRRTTLYETSRPMGKFTRITGTGGKSRWRYDHAWGTAVIEAGTVSHYFTVTDPAGSCRVVVDMAGRVSQSASYFPDGLPVGRTDEPVAASTEVTDRLYESLPYIGHAGAGWTDNGARFLDNDFGRFLSPDKHSGSYPWLSPYANRADNPFRFADPTGNDVWKIGEDGTIILHTEDTTEDRIELTYDNGTVISDGDNRPRVLRYRYGTVEGVEHREYTFASENKTYQYMVFKVRGDYSGQEIFKFLSYGVGSLNGIEYGLTQVGEDWTGMNFITTGQIQYAEPGISGYYMQELIGRYNIRRMIHSHKEMNIKSDPDRDFAKFITRHQIESDLSVPLFSIFYLPSGEFINF